MNNLLMFDHQTESIWSQFLGEAVDGQFAGIKLEFIAALVTVWATWLEMHPDTKALDKEGQITFDVYQRYYGTEKAGRYGETVKDDRLPTKERVIGLERDGEARAYPYGLPNERPVINDLFQGKPIVVVFDSKSATGAIFEREFEGVTLTFETVKDEELGSLGMRDRETGTKWRSLAGEAVEGHLAGARLKPMKSHLSFWFAWTDFYPHTQVHGQ